MASFAEIRDRKRGTRSSVEIQMDGELALRIEEAWRRYREAQRADRTAGLGSQKAPGILKEIEELTAEAQETTVKFTFRSIGRVKFNELVEQHPPTEQQQEEMKEQGQGVLQWNPETLPPVLVAASSEDPVITLDEALDIWSSPDWNEGELVKLYLAALRANQEAPDIPFDRLATELTRSTEQNSTTAPTEGFPTLSSSDE
jgi:hypothetical protein